MTGASGTEVARKEGGGGEQGGREGRKEERWKPEFPVGNHSNNSATVSVARMAVSLAGFFGGHSNCQIPSSLCSPSLFLSLPRDSLLPVSSTNSCFLFCLTQPAIVSIVSVV